MPEALCRGSQTPAKDATLDYDALAEDVGTPARHAMPESVSNHGHALRAEPVVSVSIRKRRPRPACAAFRPPRRLCKRYRARRFHARLRCARADQARLRAMPYRH